MEGQSRVRVLSANGVIRNREIKMQTARYEVTLIRAWVQRRRSDGIEPPADVIWQMIRTLWPGLSEKEKQCILLVLDIVPARNVMSQ